MFLCVLVVVPQLDECVLLFFSSCLFWWLCVCRFGVFEKGFRLRTAAQRNGRQDVTGGELRKNAN